jgi:hypothetical protein
MTTKNVSQKDNFFGAFSQKYFIVEFASEDEPRKLLDTIVRLNDDNSTTIIFDRVSEFLSE